MFKFGRSEAAKEQFAHQLAKKYDHDKGLNINDGHTRIRFGDVNHRRVELLPLVVGIADDGGRQGQAGSGQQRRPHPGGQRGRRIRQFVAFFLDYTAENVKNYEESTSVLSLISTDRIFDPRLATKFQIAKIFLDFIFEYFLGE